MQHKTANEEMLKTKKSYIYTHTLTHTHARGQTHSNTHTQCIHTGLAWGAEQGSKREDAEGKEVGVGGAAGGHLSRAPEVIYKHENTRFLIS
jgi:hypothetical protein